MSLEDIPRIVEEEQIKIVVVAVPADGAQDVANRFIRAGVKCILNYAPVKLTTPDTVQVASVDLSLELQRLAYYIPKHPN
jgi:redox-sensing transcriptional repressor